MSKILTALWMWADINGVQADIQFNTLFLLGKRDETTSLHAAHADASGKRWGCIFCHWLNVIEKDHCAKVLAGDPTPTFAALRAGGALGLFYLGMLCILFSLWRLA